MMTWAGFYFHSPSNFLMEFISMMHDYVMIFLLSIMILVIFNLTYSFLFSSFNFYFCEHHQLETVWTLVPFIILILIAAPSLMTLYMLDSCFFCGVTVNVMGHQWYWSYFYSYLKSINFDSYMVPSESSHIRLLEVDNRLVIPSFLPIRFLLSSSDVLHSWTIPSFGVKMDAIPGRINQFCFSSKRSGIFFGQCSEICGANHSFMPVVMESIPFIHYVESLNLK